VALEYRLPSKLTVLPAVDRPFGMRINHEEAPGFLLDDKSPVQLTLSVDRFYDIDDIFRRDTNGI
jgi:hypothetical protein